MHQGIKLVNQTVFKSQFFNLQRLHLLCTTKITRAICRHVVKLNFQEQLTTDKISFPRNQEILQVNYPPTPIYLCYYSRPCKLFKVFKLRLLFRLCYHKMTMRLSLHRIALRKLKACYLNRYLAAEKDGLFLTFYH